MHNEPALNVAGMTALVAAVITLAVAFGLPLSDEQIQAILGFTAVVGPIVVGVLTRRKVKPVKK